MTFCISAGVFVFVSKATLNISVKTRNFSVSSFQGHAETLPVEVEIYTIFQLPSFYELRFVPKIKIQRRILELDLKCWGSFHETQ